MAIFWHELVDIDARLHIFDGFRVILSSTIHTLMLGLFDSNLNLFWHAQVYEGIHAASILFEHLCLLNNPWKIGQDETISSSICDSEQFYCQLIFKLLINISCIKHVFGF